MPFTLLILLTLFVIGISLVATVLLGHSILGNLNRAVRRGSRQLQFQITDFACLVVQLQVALASVVALVPSDFRAHLVTLLVFSTVSLTAMWFAAVRTMSLAGVTERGRRSAFILILLPGTAFFMGCVISYICFTPVAVFALIESLADNEFPYELRVWAVILLVNPPILFVVWWLLRQLSRWITRGLIESQVAANDAEFPLNKPLPARSTAAPGSSSAPDSSSPL